MPTNSNQDVFAALLDSWDRNNTILLNLLRAVPAEELDHRVMAGGFSIAGMFTHIDYCRRYFVAENVPEIRVPELPDDWRSERNPGRLVQLLEESAKLVPEAVTSRLEAAREMDRHYDHPILMLQHLIWHEAYHHGQIKLILKLAGRPLNDDDGSLITFDLWMDKSRRLAL